MSDTVEKKPLSTDPPSIAKGLWNYRVIEFVDPSGEPWRAIFEVHYRDGLPVAYTEEPAVVLSDEENNDGLAWALDRMREALDKPVLVERDFDEARKQLTPPQGGKP